MFNEKSYQDQHQSSHQQITFHFTFLRSVLVIYAFLIGNRIELKKPTSWAIIHYLGTVSTTRRSNRHQFLAGTLQFRNFHLLAWRVHGLVLQQKFRCQVEFYRDFVKLAWMTKSQHNNLRFWMTPLTKMNRQNVIKIWRGQTSIASHQKRHTLLQSFSA